MRRIVRTAVLGGFLLACAPDVTEQSMEPVSQTAAVGSCTIGSGTQNVYQHYNCNTNVYLNVQSLTSAAQGTITSAAQQWNAVLYNRFPQLPRLTTDPAVTPKHYTITVSFSGASSSTWCGGVSPGGSARPTSLVVGTTASGNQCGAPLNVAVHELGHIIGFGGDWHTPGTEILKHCAIALKTGVVNNVNTHGPCPWEVETLLEVYGARQAPPNAAKHVITGLTGSSGPTSLVVPNNGTIGFGSYVLQGANGLLCGLTSRDACFAEDAWKTMTGSLNWTSSDTDVATVTTPGAQTTVTAVGAGTTTITAKPRPITTYEIGTDAKATRGLTVTTPPPPAAPPSSLSVSNITGTSGLLSWTNGDNTASTSVQYRMSGQTGWINATGAGLPPGQSSYTLSGLHCATTYQVEVFHVKNGIGSSVTPATFTTGACQVSASVNPPTAFIQFSCTPSTSGGKEYATYNLRWTAGSNPTGSLYQIGHAFSNSSGGAAVIRVGSIKTVSANVGPYLVNATSSPRYFWVRHANGSQASTWVALQGNPIEIEDGCLN